MTDRSISPLRRRMIEDMTVRGFTASTQRGYIRAVKDFTAFLGRSPDQAGVEDLRRYQQQMRSGGASATSMNAAVSALRFFFTVTLGRGDAQVGMTTVRAPRKLPVILSPEEVARLLDAAPGLKYKAALSVAYGAGLRASEVVSLNISDIDSERMVIRVEQGKGRKDRYVMLSRPLLDLLRAWWRIARPQAWLFAGQNPINPLTTRQLRRACHAAAEAAEGLCHWLETPTAVAVRLEPDGALTVIAPFGLADLFDLRSRPAPVGRARWDDYLARMRAKDWPRRWPRVRVEGLNV